MTLKMIAMAGGLLALVAAALAHFTRNRSSGIANDQVSGDWLAQARGKEEPW